MEQSSILSAKFDYPVAHQNISLLVTVHDVHDCETGLWRHSLLESAYTRRTTRKACCHRVWYFLYILMFVYPFREVKRKAYFH